VTVLLLLAVVVFRPQRLPQTRDVKRSEEPAATHDLSMQSWQRTQVPSEKANGITTRSP
jgi:hypothetical protein